MVYNDEPVGFIGATLSSVAPRCLCALHNAVVLPVASTDDSRLPFPHIRPALGDEINAIATHSKTL